MRRVVVAVAVLLSLLAMPVFGGGSRDTISQPGSVPRDGQHWLRIVDPDDVPVGQVGFFLDEQAENSVDVVLPAEGQFTGAPFAAVYKRNGQWYWGSGTLRDEPLGFTEPADFAPDAATDPLVVVPRGELPFPLDAVYHFGSFTTVVPPLASASLGTQEFGFSIGADGSSSGQTVDFYVLYGDGTYQNFVVSSESEFFEGERAFFSQLPGVSYQQKALSLLRIVMRDAPGRDSYFTGIHGGVPDVYDPNSVASDAELAEMASRLATSLGARFPTIFDQAPLYPAGSRLAEVVADIQDGDPDPPLVSDSIGMVVLSVPENVGLSWYSASRNIYVSAYIAYASWYQERPLAERAIYSVLDSNGIAYRADDYSALDAAEGAELAQSALRYLTWGVEYSLVDKLGFPNEEFSANTRQVFATAMSDDGLRRWITGNGTGDGANALGIDVEIFTGQSSGIGRSSDGSPLPSSEIQALEGNPYFQADGAGSGLSNSLRDRFSTPFGQNRAGNSVAFVPFGIDTPRTFNYKLYEQARSRASLWISSRDPRRNPLNSDGDPTTALPPLGEYVSQQELRVEPFFAPRFQDSDAVRVTELFSLDQSPGLPLVSFAPGPARSRAAEPSRAGVGNIELLGGAMSMTGMHERLLGADNRRIAEPYRTLARMDEAEMDGILLSNTGTAGRPAIADDMGSAEWLRHVTTLSRADIERSSLIVPDVSLIQPGDLLVRFSDESNRSQFDRLRDDRYGNPSLPANSAAQVEIAIVVGMSWEDGGASPAYGEDIRQWYDDVYVVTASPTYEAVVLASWGHGGTTIRTGFTEAPGTYQMRRLLLSHRSSTREGLPTVADWDVVDQRPEELQMSIAWKNDEYEQAKNGREDVERRWLSNISFADGTFDVLPAESIVVTARTAAGRRVSIGQSGFIDERFEGGFVPVEFLGPADPHASLIPEHRWDNAENIYNNSGAGIEIVVRDSAGQWRPITRFERSGSEGEPAPYTEVDAPLDWHQSDHRDDGSRPRGLYVWRDQLVYLRTSATGSQTIFADFGVRVWEPASGQRVRHGDDYALRLALDPALSSRSVSPALAAAEDIIAVVDHKMLWRANLYIDERKNEGDTVTDWNEVYPWAFDNEWNREYRTDRPSPVRPIAELGQPQPIDQEATIETQLEQGDGGQVVSFFPWTPLRGDPNQRVRAVAYDYPYSWADDAIIGTSGGLALETNPYQQDKYLGDDSPFDFNNKLQGLQAQMEEFAAAYVRLNGADSGSAEYAPGVTFSQLAGWDSTAAPGAGGSVWANYLNDPNSDDLQPVYEEAGIVDLYVPQMGFFYFSRKIPLEGVYAGSNGMNRESPALDNDGDLENKWDTPGTVYGSFQGDQYVLSTTPGGNAYTVYDRPTNLWGTGTDCVGFAQQAASYGSAVGGRNPYSWYDLRNRDVENLDEYNGEQMYRVFPRIDEDTDGAFFSELILNRDTFLSLTPADRRQALRYVRPGDLMYYAPGHIAIVQQVYLDENGEVAGLESIRFIEAVYFTPENEDGLANVTNARTMGSVSSRNWRIVRLKEE